MRYTRFSLNGKINNSEKQIINSQCKLFQITGKKNSKIRIIAAFIFAAAIVFQITFIISNSLKNSENSDEQSGYYVKIVVEKIMHLDYDLQSESFLGQINHVIRKAAHFSEYALLSVFVFMFFYIVCFEKKFCFFASSGTAFVVGCIDEFVQLFSPGRACRFTDVLIDTAGGIFAGAALIVIIKIMFKIKRRYS